MPAASARERSSSAGLLSIGQVLARLAPEFPTLTSSKLRFLEVQGIVTPVRTDSGYRKFSPADLERLRLALTLQRDHYLPLVVIREYLEDVDAGRDPHRPPRPRRRRSSRAAPLSPRGAAVGGRGGSAAAQRRRSARECIAGVGHLHRPARSRCCARSSRSIGTASSRATCGRCGRAPSAMSRSSNPRSSPLLRRTDAGSRARASELAPELAKRLEDVRAMFVRGALDRLMS